MLSSVPQYGLFFEELRALLAKGGMVAFAIDAVGSSCPLKLVSMLLAATITHSVGSSALVLAMSKIMTFETAHWKWNVRSHWHRKVASSQACRRLKTIESQDDCVGWNPDVSLSHMDASRVNDVRKFVHKLLFRTTLKAAMFDDTPGRVEALVGPNSHRDIQTRRDIFQFLFLVFTTQLYHEVTTTLFGDSMGLRAQNSDHLSVYFER